MKETGIIISGDHPQKIVNLLKTQTRRTTNLKEINRNPNDWECGSVFNGMVRFYNSTTEEAKTIKCPYGQAGDRLVIKETWATENRYNHLKPSEVPQTAKIWYLADEQYDPFTMGIVRSAMFMCFWMSRAKPEIIEVRVERVQEITEEDAKAEGCIVAVGDSARYDFMILWHSLNAKRGYGWDFNPWVWPLTFKPIQVGV